MEKEIQNSFSKNIIYPKITKMKETNKLFSRQWNEKYPIVERSSVYAFWDIIIKGLIVIFLMAMALALLQVANSRSEVVECNKIKAQSEQKYDAKFFIKEWQDDMCRAHGIIINAEVK